MARIVGFERFAAREIPATHLFLLCVVAVSLIGFMLVAPGDWRSDLPSLLGTVAVILILVGFALNRVNPMSWKRVFHKADYQRQLAGNRTVLGVLQELGDEYLVLCCFTFELIYVEFLVFGPKGIFVIGTMYSSDPLRVDGEGLVAGHQSLQRQTGNLWRTCHLLNLVIHKGYEQELMPRPVLVATYAETVAFSEHGGIALVTPDSLLQVLQSSDGEDVPLSLVQGMGAYVRERYLR
ncbi:MAG: hypothetical protein AB7U29_06990 [Desulfobulbus sp.]